MKTVGIIAEFNPFHNGHEYIIKEAKERTGADYCVVVMSGSFTQRGEPSCMYKYDRVKSALMCGTDAVFELPVSYATGTAESFAHGGVCVLDALGCIDTLVFGTEKDDIAGLNEAASILLDPPGEYKEALDNALKQGLSYPAARAAALPQYEDILSSPNNILAVEYLKALKRLGSDIETDCVLRRGSGYHENELNEYASAEAIRSAFSSADASNAVFGSVPKAAHDIMVSSYGRTFPICADDMSSLAEYVLLSSSAEELAGYQDMNRDIANRFINTFSSSGEKEDVYALSDLLKDMRTKELTYTRLSRALLHCLLRLKDMTHYDNGDLIACPYTRLLGFRSDASELMHTIAKASSIPIINKAGDALSLLPPEALPYFEATVRADRIYDMLIKNKYGTRLTDGCRISPVII